MFHHLMGFLFIALDLLLVFYLIGMLACGWTSVMQGTAGRFCFVCKGLRWPWNY